MFIRIMVSYDLLYYNIQNLYHSTRAVIEMTKKKILLGSAVFITCFFIYLIGWSGHFYSIDGMITFQFAKQIAFLNSFQFSPPLTWGEVIIPTSKWALGLTYLYLPLLWIGARISGNPAIFTTLPAAGAENFQDLMFFDPAYRSISLVHLCIAAASAAGVYALSTQLGFKSKQAAATAFIFGLLSPAAVYSRFDYAQPLAGLFLLLSFTFFIAGWKKRSSFYFLLSGLMMSSACLTRVELFGLAAPLPVVIFLFKRPHAWKKHLLSYGLPIVAALFLQGWFNYLRFDHFFQFGYEPISEFNLQPIAVLQALLSLLINPRRGLIVFFPISLFAFAAFKEVNRDAPLLKWAFWWLLILPLLFYAGWRDWHAGYTWGPRFLIPFLPYWTIAAMYTVFTKEKAKSPLFLAACLLSGLAVLQGFLFDRLSGAKSLFEPQSLQDFLTSFPYFYRLEDFFTLSRYDSFWVKQLQIGWGERSFLFIGILIFCAAAMLGWVLWFKRQRSHLRSGKSPYLPD